MAEEASVPGHKTWRDGWDSELIYGHIVVDCHRDQTKEADEGRVRKRDKYRAGREDSSHVCIQAADRRGSGYQASSLVAVWCLQDRTSSSALPPLIDALVAVN